MSTTVSPCVNSTCAVGVSNCRIRPNGSQYCVCFAGYRGANCTTDLNECHGHQPCFRRGMCLNTPGSYRCDCLSGWQGVHCETRDLSHSVECITGWKGPNCTDDIDECKILSSDPCYNHGTCDNKPGGYTCRCSPGWTGQNCTQDVDECLSNPCKHGGHCFNTIGSFSCTCASVWSGPICEEHPCSSNPCNNGGICSDKDKTSYRCDCNAPWVGQNCQINTTCAPNPCKHAGTCTNTTGNIQCTCVGQWEGLFCDVNSTTTSSNNSPDVGMISGVVIGSSVFVGGVAGTLFLLWRLSRKGSVDPDLDNTVIQVKSETMSSTGYDGKETEVTTETSTVVMDGDQENVSGGKQINDGGIVMKTNTRFSILRSIRQFHK